MLDRLSEGTTKQKMELLKNIKKPFKIEISKECNKLILKSLNNYRLYQKAYHFMCSSQERWEYLESQIEKNKFNRTYWVECNSKQQNHHHRHALVFSDRNLKAIQQDFYRNCQVKDKKSKFRQILCEDYLIHTIIYFHCTEGQTGHIHNHSKGVISRELIHQKIDKQNIFQYIISKYPINHPQDCSCIGRKISFTENRRKYESAIKDDKNSK